MSSTAADLYDTAGDAGPRLMCAGCGQIEVGVYEPVCPECRKSLEQAGILQPQDQRQVIPYHGGRRSNDTMTWRDATELEKEQAARIAELEALLKDIGDYAHDNSTGPAVPDALWTIRGMAYDG